MLGGTWPTRRISSMNRGSPKVFSNMRKTLEKPSKLPFPRYIFTNLVKLPPRFLYKFVLKQKSRKYRSKSFCWWFEDHRKHLRRWESRRAREIPSKLSVPFYQFTNYKEFATVTYFSHLTKGLRVLSPFTSPLTF